MVFAKVIKYEGDNRTFVWKHPAENFITGSQLIVHETQEAVFFQNGRILDTFPPGRYTLETENLPVITAVMRLPTGGRNPFHCELYFINQTEQMAIPWGTDSKIQYMDSVYNFPVQIGCCGEMSLKIENSERLLIKLVGTEKRFSQEDIVTYFRALIMKYVKSILPQMIRDNGLSVFELDQHLSEFSDGIYGVLAGELQDYGIDLRQFSIMTIQMPDDDMNYIRFRQLYYRQVTEVAEAELQQRLDIIAQETKARRAVIEAEAMARKRALEGYSYQEEQSFGVAREIAGNEAVGQMSNIGVGVGMMTGIGGSIGNAVSSAARGAIDNIGAAVARPGLPARFCQSCGHPVSGNHFFCENCGEKIPDENNTCANCGSPLSPAARFCPVCGTRRG